MTTSYTFSQANRNVSSVGSVTELPITDAIVIVLSAGGVFLLLLALGCCLCWRFSLAAAIRRRCDCKDTTLSGTDVVVATRAKRASLVHPVPLAATDVDAAIIDVIQRGNSTAADSHTADSGAAAAEFLQETTQEHDADKVVSSFFPDSRDAESSSFDAHSRRSSSVDVPASSLPPPLRRQSFTTHTPQLVDAPPRHPRSYADCKQPVTVTRIADPHGPPPMSHRRGVLVGGGRRPSFLASSGA